MERAGAISSARRGWSRRYPSEGRRDSARPGNTASMTGSLEAWASKPAELLPRSASLPAQPSNLQPSSAPPTLRFSPPVKSDRWIRPRNPKPREVSLGWPGPWCPPISTPAIHHHGFIPRPSFPAPGLGIRPTSSSFHPARRLVGHRRRPVHGPVISTRPFLICRVHWRPHRLQTAKAERRSRDWPAGA